MDNVCSDNSAAGRHSQAGRDKRLHIIGTFILLWIYLSKAGPYVAGAHTRRWQGKFSAGWCAACCNVHSDYGISKCIGARAGNGSRRSYGSKISKYFCGVFVLLCYIPAPLTNRN
jgi:hypothetical protein